MLFLVSNVCDDVVVNSNINRPVVSKYSPPKHVKKTTNYKCACGHNLDMQPWTSDNNPYVKKQTCFHCGTPGNIAINCPNCAYVPYYAQGRQNISRGRSLKRNSSRSCSNDGD